MDFGFILIDIQTAGRDFARAESRDKGGFVNDGAARSVDDDDAVFHF